MSTRRRRIELVAQRHPNEPLTALHHHMDLNWMHEAYRRVRKDAAPGIDGQTVTEYGENLTENLRDLLARAQSGRYQAPPVKRAYGPKNDKEDRPIGLPTVEDKILQRAVTMVLEPIYELEFQPFSFGFRPGRSPHQALGYPVVMLRTARKRCTRVLQALKGGGRENRHLPLREQQRQLNEKLRGHDAYYGVAFNYRLLQRLRWEAHRLWRRWLARCNRKGARNWDPFHALRRVFPLLPPRIIHACL